jgi:NitT/TauT family transport system ATP-binding protein
MRRAARKRAYGYVFQAAGLYPWRTIAGNIKLAAGDHGVFQGRAGRAGERVLELVELKGFGKKFPWQLSGGMQQRASIARALAFDADILLMDEPFGALDEIVRDRLNEEVLKLWARTGKTIGFVTHSIPEAVYLSTKIVVMSPRPGRITDVIDSPLPKERPLDIRDSREFIEIAHRVREGLRAGHDRDAVLSGGPGPLKRASRFCLSLAGAMGTIFLTAASALRRPMRSTPGRSVLIGRAWAVLRRAIC